MPLRTKILLGYGAILVLLVAMTVWGIFDLRRLGRASREILSQNYRSILAAENMIDDLERQDSATMVALLGDREGAAAQFRQYHAEFLRWLARAEDNITIPGEAAIVTSIQVEYGQYVAAAEAALAAPPPAARPLELYRQRLLPPFEKVRGACVHLREVNQETMVAASDRATATSHRAIVSTAVVGGVTALVGLLLSVLLSDFLTRPLRAMSAATARVAEGQYDVHLNVESADELGQLAGQIQTMVRKLRGYHELNVGRLLEEKRRSEAILSSIGDGLVVVDDRFRVLAANPAAARIFEVAAEDAKGRHILEVVGEKAVYERMREIAAAGQVSPDAPELRISRDKEGRTLHYRCAVTPVRSENGVARGLVLLVQDFTRMLEVDRLKNEFVMAASHELRTPLTGIVMSLRLLVERLEETLGNEDRELLRTADEEAQRLRALVENLLDLSKIQSGRLEIEAEAVAVDSLVERALVGIRSQVEDHGITLVTDLPPKLPQVYTDPHKIVWVLTNLLSNAMRYTPRGGEISVSARAAGDDVHVSVKDTGSGIPPEQQARIFDRFVQIDGGGGKGGLGLGLALSRSIVRGQGGAIWVESEPGRGSVFTFTMPTASASRPR